MRYKLGLKLGSKDTQYTNEILRYYEQGVAANLRECIFKRKKNTLVFGYIVNYRRIYLPCSCRKRLNNESLPIVPMYWYCKIW